MSEWWETTKKILSGKAKGAKLIVLGVFLLGLGVVLPAAGIESGLVFVAAGTAAFITGIHAYQREADYELEKRRKKDAQKLKERAQQKGD
jgi:hypothetical protein